MPVLMTPNRSHLYEQQGKGREAAFGPPLMSNVASKHDSQACRFLVATSPGAWCRRVSAVHLWPVPDADGQAAAKVAESSAQLPEERRHDAPRTAPRRNC